MSDESQAAEAIYLASLSITDLSQRRAFVEQKCGENSFLRERVERFISDAAEDDPQFELQLRALVPTRIAGPPSDVAGSVIGRYRLLEKIGEGGFGLVYVAEQQEPVRRKVALKVIKPGMDSGEVIARFEAERQALALMDHNGIAKVFDAGTTENGRPYFVMELVPGIPITDYCERTQLDTRGRLELFISVCNAIQHAHLKGIIHRDIKPSNVLVTVSEGSPTVKVIDFGVAKALYQPLTEHMIHTRLTQMIGTPLYMSPEQAEMSGLNIDTRTDVYSLGVLLYELLTGLTPFDKRRLATAAHLELLRIIREEEPPTPSARLSQSSKTEPAIASPQKSSPQKSDPSRLSQLVRGELDWITMKALEKDRTRRYESARAFASDIQRYLNNDPVEAGPPSRRYRLGKFARKHVKSITAAAAFLGLLMTAVVASTWLAIRERTASAIAVKNEDAANRAKEDAQSATIELGKQYKIASQAVQDTEREKSRFQNLLYEASRSDYASAQDRFDHGEVQAGLKSLGRALRYDPANHLAKEALWFAILHQERNYAVPTHILENPLNVFSSQFSRDGNQVVVAGMDKTARFWSVQTGEPFPVVLQHPRAVKTVQFSPIGNKLLTILSIDNGRREPRIWDLTGPVPLQTSLDDERYSVFYASFNTDGSRLLTGNEEKIAHVWDCGTGALLFQLDQQMPNSHASFSPDGKRIVTACTDNTARIWNTEDGSAIGVPITHAGAVLRAKFSPDGKTIMTLCEDANIRFWNAFTGVPSAPTLVHDQTVFQAVFSPDSAAVVTVLNDDTARLWDLGTGKLVGEPIRHNGFVHFARFTPDCTRLVTQSVRGTISLWEAHTGRPIGTQVEVGVPLDDLFMKPDGGLIATGVTNNNAIITDAATLRPLPITVQHQKRIRDARFNSDGSLLVTCGDDGVAQVWNAHTGLAVGTPLIHQTRVAFAMFSHDSSIVYTSLDNRGVGTQLWNIKTGELIAEINHSSKLPEGCLSPDGLQLLTAHNTNSAKIWNARTGEFTGPEIHHGFLLRYATFSPDGKQLVTAGSDQSAQVWDTGGKSIGPPLEHKASLTSARFSIDGQRLVTTSTDGTARTWNAKSHEPIAVMTHQGQVLSAGMSRDGRRIVTSSTEEVTRLWDAGSGDLIASLPYRSDVDDSSFSPDSTRLVIGGTELRMFDAEAGIQVGMKKLQQTTVRLARFSPDGQRVVTVDMEAARIHDVRTAEPIDGAAAESLAAIASGGRLAPEIGTTTLITPAQRMAEVRRLREQLTGSPEWTALLDSCVFSSVAAPISPRSAITRRDVVDRLIRTGTLSALIEALAIDPGHPLIQIALSRLVGNGARAEFLREYGVSRLPQDAAVCGEAARLLLSADDRDRAERAISIARKTDPLHPAVMRFDAESLLQRGMFAEARVKYTALLKARPAGIGIDLQHIETMIGFATCLMNLKEYESAGSQMRTAIDWLVKHYPADPRIPGLQQSLGLILIERNQDHASAEQALLSAFKSLEVRQSETPNTQTQRSRDEVRALLARLYDAWRKPEKAEQWREMSAQDQEPDLGRVVDVMTICGATLPQLEDWFRLVQKQSYVPMSVNAQIGSSEPRFNSIAVLGTKPAKFAWAIIALSDDATTFNSQVRSFNRLAARTVYRMESETREVQIWINRSRLGWYSNIGNLNFIQERIVEHRQKACHPIHLSGASPDTPDSFTIESIEDADRNWETRLNLAPNELSTSVAGLQHDQWRPDLLCPYWDGAAVKFMISIIENKPMREWSFESELTADAIQQRLNDQKQKGYRPKSIASYGPLEQPKYSVVWVQYRTSANDEPADALRTSNGPTAP